MRPYERPGGEEEVLSLLGGRVFQCSEPSRALGMTPPRVRKSIARMRERAQGRPIDCEDQHGLGTGRATSGRDEGPMVETNDGAAGQRSRTAAAEVSVSTPFTAGSSSCLRVVAVAPTDTFCNFVLALLMLAAQ
ncbi:unnamed protein product [Lampetra planeri]